MHMREPRCRNTTIQPMLHGLFVRNSKAVPHNASPYVRKDARAAGKTSHNTSIDAALSSYSMHLQAIMTVSDLMRRVISEGMQPINV